MKLIKQLSFYIAPLLLTLAVAGAQVAACSLCRAQVKANIYNQNFYGNLLLMALPLVLIAVVGLALFHWDKFKNLKTVLWRKTDFR